MRKLLFILVLGAALLGAPVTARPSADLAALARFFPPQAPIFGVIRADDGYIETLDGLIARVLSKFPADAVPPGLSLRAALDQLAGEAGVGDFRSSIRPWLGDRLAFGILTLDSLDAAPPAFVIAADVRDRAAAEAFWQGLLERSNATFTEVRDGSYTLYAMDASDPERGGLLITDEVLLLGVGNLRRLLVTREARLNQAPAFTGTLDLLPAGDYNALLYLDLPSIMAANNDAGTRMLAGAVGPAAIGLTLLDGRSLVADIGIARSAANPLAAMGFELPSAQPIDPAFAAQLPARTSLLVQAANVNTLFESFLAAARLSGSTSDQEFERGLNQLRLSVRGVTGLRLEEDILDWMTGDYALFVTIDQQAIRRLITQALMDETPALAALPLGFGLVVEATDPAKARALAAGLGQALPQLVAQAPEVTITAAAIGGEDVTVIRVDAPLDPARMPPLEIVIGANDSVFLIATRPEAKAILSGIPGLNQDAAYAAAARYLLDDATTVWYMDSGGSAVILTIGALTMMGPVIGNVFDEIMATVDSPSALPTISPEEIRRRQQEQQRQQVRQVEDIFQALAAVWDSGTISTSSEAGGDRIRFVLTLP